MCQEFFSKMFVNLSEKKVAIYTLGCKVNQYESDSMMDILKKEGCKIVQFSEYADVYIINTCSVTNMADRKSRQIIHRAKKINPNGVVVAAGCYVQAAKEQLLQDKDIDIVVSNNRKKDIARLLDEYFCTSKVNDNFIDINATKDYEDMWLVKPSEHCRAYVKVQDGCNNFCTYCIIPYTRGRIRSRELSNVIAEIEGLVERGIKEVVITGINLSSYCDSNGASLLDLLLSVSRIPGIERIRMGSLEPRVITEEFLKAISNEPKICPHFHLSLQSACNETLKRMNRKYTIEEYMDKCNLIRKYYDRPALTTDVIVGFPGETDVEFDITYKNLQKLNLYEMHIFKYSKRNGTIAATMPNQVPEDVKNKRSEILLDMTKNHKAAFEASFVGEKINVLIEEYEEKDGKYFPKGHTERYILCRWEEQEEYCKNHVNDIVEIEYK